MTREDHRVRGAIRSLREKLVESREIFARRLGVSLRTVTRYESERPPRGKMLLQLAEIAGSADLPELAAVFAAQFERESSATSRQPIADAIRRFRGALNDTQLQFAARIGVSPVTIARYETNSIPSPEILKDLSAAARENGYPLFAAFFDNVLSPAPYLEEQQYLACLEMLQFAIESVSPEHLRKMALALTCLTLPEEKVKAVQRAIAPYLAETQNCIEQCSSDIARSQATNLQGIYVEALKNPSLEIVTRYAEAIFADYPDKLEYWKLRIQKSCDDPKMLIEDMAELRQLATWVIAVSFKQEALANPVDVQHTARLMELITGLRVSPLEEEKSLWLPSSYKADSSSQ